MQKRQNLPIVCGTLVVINVIVYLICTFTGDLLYNIGELDAVAVLRYGEYGRIISSTFLSSLHNHPHNVQFRPFHLYCIIILFLTISFCYFFITDRLKAKKIHFSQHFHSKR